MGEPKAVSSQQMDLRDVRATQPSRVVTTVSKTSSWEDGDRARTDSTSTIAASCARGPGWASKASERLAGLGAGVVVHVGLPVTQLAQCLCPRALGPFRSTRLP